MQLSQHHQTIPELFLASGKSQDAQRLRDEDATKQTRLGVLTDTIGLPHPRPYLFPVAEVVSPSQRFRSLLDEKGSSNCAFRLDPLVKGLPKIRTRGLALRNAYEDWFPRQKFDHDKYNVSISFYSLELAWGIVIVCKPEGITGEIIKDSPDKIILGETGKTLFQFLYDFKKWEWTINDPEVAEIAKKTISYLHVTDRKKQNELREKLGANFCHDYLEGYFEAMIPVGGSIDFYEYNRVLPEKISIPEHLPANQEHKDVEEIGGSTAYPGCVRGNAMIVDNDTVDSIKTLPDRTVLVVDNTDARYLSLISQAIAVVANRGSILSHVAIITRELKKPCIVRTLTATKVFKNGDLIEVDADNGIVRKIKREE